MYATISFKAVFTSLNNVSLEILYIEVVDVEDGGVDVRNVLVQEEEVVCSFWWNEDCFGTFSAWNRDEHFAVKRKLGSNLDT